MHATLIATDAQVAYFKETYAVWKRQGFPCADARMLPLLEIINSLDGLSSVYCCEGHPASNRSGQTKASRFYILLAATEVGHTHMAQITYNLRTLLKSQVAAKENCAYEPSKLALKYCEMVAMATDERPLEFFFYNAVIFEGGTTNNPKIKSKFLKSFLSVLQEYANALPRTLAVTSKQDTSTFLFENLADVLSSTPWPQPPHSHFNPSLTPKEITP